MSLLVFAGYDAALLPVAILVHEPGPPVARYTIKHGVIYVEHVILAEPQLQRVSHLFWPLKQRSDVETVSWLVLYVVVSLETNH